MYLKHIGITSVFILGMIILGYIILHNDTSPSGENSLVTLNDVESVSLVPADLTIPDNRFGIPDYNLMRINGTVQRNETLHTILSKYGVEPQTVLKLVQQSKGVFNVRHIKPGHIYHVYEDIDSLHTPEYFVYEETPVNYVVFKFRDSTGVYTGKQHIHYVTHTASGIIRSSLFETMEENDLDPYMADALADIFAWQIDFYHLRKEDRFKVIYTDKIVNGEAIGLGYIKAASFQSGNITYYAFRFDNGKRVSYYDQDGNSLRKAFLKAPLKYSYISSRFSRHRYHPILHRYMPHLGVDFAAPTGTPVHSVGDGVIEIARYNKWDGNYIKIRHNSVYQTEYLHLNHFAHGIHPGVHVKQGQLIGYVGSTGLATGPHLDFRYWKNGREVNPLTLKIPPSHPIKPKNMPDYTGEIKPLQAELNSISFNNGKNDNLVETRQMNQSVEVIMP